jgi:CheY-like chemotaxis protein
VIEAADGVTACDRLFHSPERLVAVVDHKMPRMDGCDVLELAASDERMRARHVFSFVTASPRKAVEDCGDTLDKLDVPLVPKPFETDELLDVVADAAKRLAAS